MTFRTYQGRARRRPLADLLDDVFDALDAAPGALVLALCIIAGVSLAYSTLNATERDRMEVNQ